MPPDPDRRLRPRMTLRQVGVLVIFVAVGLSVLTSIGRSVENPLVFLLLGTVELPFALILPIMVLVRPGPLKNWALSVNCAIPLVALLAYLNLVAVTGWLSPRFYLHSTHLDVGGTPVPIGFVVAVADVLLLAGLAYLGRLTIPARCPTCGRRAMLLDPSVPRRREFPGRGRARSCLACGSRFRRRRGGPWVDVDLATDRPESPASSLTPSTTKDHAR